MLNYKETSDKLISIMDMLEKIEDDMDSDEDVEDTLGAFLLCASYNVNQVAHELNAKHEMIKKMEYDLSPIVNACNDTLGKLSRRN